MSGKATTVLKAEATWLDEGEEYAQAKMVEAFGVTFDTDRKHCTQGCLQGHASITVCRACHS